PDDDVDGETLGRGLQRLFAQPPDLGLTLAVVAVHRGRIVAEGYGPDTDKTTRLISWSTAKSMTHALTGLALDRCLVDLQAPAPVPEWRDDRAAITLQHLLTMTPGLRFAEDYVDASVSDCIAMLFGEGKEDTAAYAAALPLDHQPGTFWNYSSGTTNIVSRIVGQVVGGEAGMRKLLMRDLFGTLGMHTAVPTFDAAGTFVGSSFVNASARDFARFGYLYLRDGIWQGDRLLPVGWRDHARTPTLSVPPEEDFGYGAHWWLWRDEPGSLAAHGYEGQYVIVLPHRDLVLVRLGKTPTDIRPNLVAVLRDLIGCFPLG
ncbi:MAG TPA: serine hydrolase, partial [Acidimicrobiales bacterium]